MAKSKKNKKSPSINRSALRSEGTSPIMASNTSWLNPRWHTALLFCIAFLLYANTFTHDYTQDDAIVIYDNMFTQDGFDGIPGIWNYDTFYGFFKEEGKANLVTGGRYRPFTLMMFAVEWQFFGKNPFIGHLINVLLYGFLGIMIYKMLSLLLLGSKLDKDGKMPLLIFITCLLFIVHPIHTEVVANIKGRDEIMTMLGAITAFWASIKYYKTNQKLWLIISFISFLIALLSKENAITYLAVVPIGYLFFKRETILKSVMQIWPLALATLLFLVKRTQVLGMNFENTSMELLNNPYLKLSGSNWVPFSLEEKMATILFTLGKYVSLLAFPHPLSHDYYPRAVEIMHFSDWQVLLSAALYIGMAIATIVYWRKDKIISFGILYFIITLSIVSNIVFPIGTNMSERFMFMPSLGLLLVVARLFTKHISNKSILLGVVTLATLLMSFKTVTRNKVWANDFTLFTTDVKTNPRSAKLLNAAGGALTTTSSKLTEGSEKTKNLNQAIGYLKQAIDIHPTYRDAYLLLGNAHFYLKKYDESISYFEKVLRLYPNFKDAKTNLPVVLRDAGRYYGQEKNDIAKSEAYLLKSIQHNPSDPETLRLLGIVSGIKGDYPSALKYFNKILELDPKSAGAHVNLGTTYQNMGDKEKARAFFEKAVELDPNALNKLGQ